MKYVTYSTCNITKNIIMCIAKIHQTTIPSCDNPAKSAFSAGMITRATVLSQDRG